MEMKMGGAVPGFIKSLNLDQYFSHTFTGKLSMSYGRCIIPQTDVTIDLARSMTDYLTFGVEVSTKYQIAMCSIVTWYALRHTLVIIITRPTHCMRPSY